MCSIQCFELTYSNSVFTIFFIPLLIGNVLSVLVDCTFLHIIIICSIANESFNSYKTVLLSTSIQKIGNLRDRLSAFFEIRVYRQCFKIQTCLTPVKLRFQLNISELLKVSRVKPALFNLVN